MLAASAHYLWSSPEDDQKAIDAANAAHQQWKQSEEKEEEAREDGEACDSEAGEDEEACESENCEDERAEEAIDQGQAPLIRANPKCATRRLPKKQRKRLCSPPSPPAEQTEAEMTEEDIESEGEKSEGSEVKEEEEEEEDSVPFLHLEEDSDIEAWQKQWADVQKRQDKEAFFEGLPGDVWEEDWEDEGWPGDVWEQDWEEEEWTDRMRPEAANPSSGSGRQVSNEAESALERARSNRSRIAEELADVQRRQDKEAFNEGLRGDVWEQDWEEEGWTDRMTDRMAEAANRSSGSSRDVRSEAMRPEAANPSSGSKREERSEAELPWYIRNKAHDQNSVALQDTESEGTDSDMPPPLVDSSESDMPPPLVDSSAPPSDTECFEPPSDTECFPKFPEQHQYLTNRNLFGKFGTRALRGRAAAQKRAEAEAARCPAYRKTAPGIAFAARKREEAEEGQGGEKVDEFQFVGGCDEDGKARCLTCGSTIRYRNMCKHIEKCTSSAKPPTNVTMAQMRNWNVTKDGMKQANQTRLSGLALYKRSQPCMFVRALSTRQKKDLEVVQPKHRSLIAFGRLFFSTKVLL